MNYVDTTHTAGIAAIEDRQCYGVIARRRPRMRYKHLIADDGPIPKIPGNGSPPRKTAPEACTEAYDDVGVVALDRNGRRIGLLKLVSAHVHGAIGNAQIAVEIGETARVTVRAGVDSSRAKLKTEVASSLVYERGRSG